MVTTVNTILNEARKYIGTLEGSAQHYHILDVYNSIEPIPQGVYMKEHHDWCDVFITFLAIQTGATDIIGRECGVQRHIEIFKGFGIWIPGSSVVPKPGYIITFDWDQDYFADHIGIVESVGNGIVNTIEGNSADMVRRNQYQIGDTRILGYASPRYSGSSSNVTPPPATGTNPKYKMVQETGKFYPNQSLKIRSTPSKTGAVVGEYTKGESFTYDAYTINEGLVWLSYISYSGQRRYVAWRVQNGDKYGRIEGGSGGGSTTTKPTPPSSPSPTPSPKYKRVSESGTYYPDRVVAVRNAPTVKSPQVATYSKGESLNYDSYVVSEGYVWLSYIGGSGQRRYVAWRVQNGTKYGRIGGGTTESPKPTTPVKPTPTVPPTNTGKLIFQSGKFYPSQTVAIRNRPSRTATHVGTYRPGESFTYDGYVKAEGMVWLSYIGGSGARRYVAWRVENGMTFGTIK